MSLVTFETKCWEKDWEYIIKEGYEEKLKPFEGYKFNEKLLIINNVNEPAVVCREADKLKERGIIDNWYLVKDYEEEVLSFFNLNKNSFLENNNDGYYYSISELTSIYLSKSDFILHFSSDSIFKTNGYNWLTNSLDVMHNNNKVVCTSAFWENKTKNKLDYGCRFSDHLYLLKKEIFKRQIYNIKDSAIWYPAHGGNSFEKIVYSFLYHNKETHLIMTDYNHYYFHDQHFPPKK